MRNADDERIDFPGSLPFLGMHLACLLVAWTGVTTTSLVICMAFYALRMFGITGGYHRYFSHRSYKTSRAFQFVLGCVGAIAAQKGPLWWAAHHRHHHGFSDTANDVHSPVVRGFWWSHVGWFLCGKYSETDVDLVKDLAQYPELVFLDRFYMLPPLASAVFALASGWLLKMVAPGLNTSPLQILVWGFFVSTVLAYHGTFLVNSLAHVVGSRRFPTSDASRNNFLIALITFGEGWHNNHHYAPSSERHGFYWWEIDLSHWILKALSSFGLVWDLRAPPSRAYEEALRWQMKASRQSPKRDFASPVSDPRIPPAS